MTRVSAEITPKAGTMEPEASPHVEGQIRPPPARAERQSGVHSSGPSMQIRGDHDLFEEQFSTGRVVDRATAP